MPKAHWRILIVAALCVAALLTMVIREAAARINGTEIALEMAAVDPRALLSGHYVIVSLRERLDPGDACFSAADDVEWLALAPNGGAIGGVSLYSLFAAGASRDAVRAPAPTVLVRGAFTCTPPSIEVETEPRPGWVDLDLGVSRFHVNQAEAERIQSIITSQRPDETRVYAILAIGRDGRARLKALVVDGVREELNWL